MLAYDYTVLAGTQGLFSHKKMDRMLRLAHDWKFPWFSSPKAAAAGPAIRMPAWSPAWTVPPLPFARSAAKPRGGDRLRALLCRQCRPVGLLRCDHRHPEFQYRHGRTGHDRRRRAWASSGPKRSVPSMCRPIMAWSISPWRMKPRRWPWPKNISPIFRGR